jgi:hypothetical protein
VDGHATEVLPDRLTLAGVDTRTDLQPELRNGVAEALGAADCPGRSVECREHAVPDVLPDAAAERLNLAPGDVVVALQQPAPLAVAQLGRALRRSDYVGEED